MPLITLRFAALGVAFSASSALLAAPLDPRIPAATAITARLLTPLSSYSSKPGDSVGAAVVSPICFGGTPLPVGTTLLGEVKRVHRVGFGIEHETAAMELGLGQLGLPDGTGYPVQARLTAIQNARERVDRHGVIRGIRATDSLSSRFSSRLLFAAHAHPAVLIPALIIETWVFRFPEPEFEYGAGAELHLNVSFPAEMGAVSACPQKDLAPALQAEAQNLLADVPVWTYSKRQPQPMDPINLLFVGSRANVETAFQAAGWTGSRPNSVRSGFQAVRAIAENRGYPDAPMRTLLLDGLEPELRQAITAARDRVLKEPHSASAWGELGMWLAHQDRGADRAVLPPPVPDQPGRLELAAARCAPGVRGHPAILVRPGSGWLPDRRGARPVQGREAA